MNNSITEEANAFDRQILERVNNGHIPDMRLTQKCGYFYNNPWSHPEYVKLDMYEQYQLFDRAIRDNFPNLHTSSMRILEVGCGPGYLSLELARTGYNVTGIDISSECIKIARHFAEKDPWKSERGQLNYVQGDFFSSTELAPGNFEVVVFLGTLHHFRDQNRVMSRVQELLSENGIIIVHEPTRDRVTEGNVLFTHMLQLILSLGGGFYKKKDIPKDIDEHKKEIKKLYMELKYEDEEGLKTQSVNDNEAGHKEMYEALKYSFNEITYQERYAFFHEIIGGLRFEEQTNIALAKFLKDVDSLLCKLGMLQSTEFFFVGSKKGDK